MVWKYVKPLSDEKSIEVFECLTGFIFPDSFKECIKQYNGARPSYRVFNTNKKTGRELKSFLSFNRTDKETVWKFYEWCKADFQDKYIPFAIDNFGNLICFDRSGKIVFVNHETLEIEIVASSFEEFLKRLYFVTYYKDRDTGNIVRFIQGYGRIIEFLCKNDLVWRRVDIHANSNYARELYLGEGNNCLVIISQEEAMKIISEWGASE